jgi:hypothetical protein
VKAGAAPWPEVGYLAQRRGEVFTGAQPRRAGAGRDRQASAHKGLPGSG